jgi:hypothetical protein
MAEPEPTRTMAELHRSIAKDRLAEPALLSDLAGPAESGDPEPLRAADPEARNDELLAELPTTDHHLGAFSGWRSTRKIRWFLGSFGFIVVTISAVVMVRHTLEMRNERLHPMPELEATVAPGESREATYSEGAFRIGISREEPYINLVHLPDRDITLARFSEKAQFKVEVRDGKTIALEVLTGDIVETLTTADAEPLLED